MPNKEIDLIKVGQRIMDRRKSSVILRRLLLSSAMSQHNLFLMPNQANGQCGRKIYIKSLALGVITDYLLTGDIVDKNLLLLSDKLKKLSPQQLRLVKISLTSAICCSTLKMSNTPDLS